jgi:hypothetical protein
MTTGAWRAGIRWAASPSRVFDASRDPTVSTASRQFHREPPGATGSPGSSPDRTRPQATTSTNKDVTYNEVPSLFCRASERWRLRVGASGCAWVRAGEQGGARPAQVDAVVGAVVVITGRTLSGTTRALPLARAQ